MNFIDEILTREEFKKKPPVLLDIGSSGHLVEKWRNIARYSICIAFDADKRDIEYLVEENKRYKKLFLYNCIVSDKENGEKNFFLTKSPHCSSSLKPDIKALSNYVYSFYGLFTVKKKVKLKAISLKKILRDLKIKKVDWFKTDSQGIDLRLFNNLESSTRKSVLVADFEPGIIDAYQGEDKLADLLLYMDKLPFWVSNINMGNSYRINSDILSKKLSKKKIEVIIQSSNLVPCYAEITYMNSFCDKRKFNKRDYLLMWVLAILNKQYGFSLEIIIKGNEKFKDKIFNKLENYTFALIEREIKKKKIPTLLKLYRNIKNEVKMTTRKLNG